MLPQMYIVYFDMFISDKFDKILYKRKKYKRDFFYVNVHRCTKYNNYVLELYTSYNFYSLTECSLYTMNNIKLEIFFCIA